MCYSTPTIVGVLPPINLPENLNAPSRNWPLVDGVSLKRSTTSSPARACAQALVYAEGLSHRRRADADHTRGCIIVFRVRGCGYGCCDKSRLRSLVQAVFGGHVLFSLTPTWQAARTDAPHFKRTASAHVRTRTRTHARALSHSVSPSLILSHPLGPFRKRCWSDPASGWPLE